VPVPAQPLASLARPKPMRPREDDLTGTKQHTILSPGRPHVVAMWPGGTAAKEIPEGGRLTAGRSKTCDIWIDHPSVSREHVTFHGTRPVEVEDLGSTNGTSVGGVRIPKETRMSLERGQVVSIGAAILVVHGLYEPLTPPAPRRPIGPQGRDEQPPVIIVDDAMRELHRIVDLVAKGDLSVVLLGETGTGKDVLADAIHHRSPRAAGPFVRLNCAALPDALLESELFGYERGAFTGAVQAKPGLLEIADGGSLFLDEVGELSLGVQAKFLRVLENREITRVGGLKARRIDVRIICATNRDLSAQVRSASFRQDLYFRLNGITLTIPPLRARRSEIAPLVQEFVRAACRRAKRPELPLTADALAFLERNLWPGNVRELRNAVDRAVTLCTDNGLDVRHFAMPENAFVSPQEDRATTPLLITPASLPSLPSLPSSRTDSTPPAAGDGVGLQEDARRATKALERRRIAEAMDRCGGNQTRAAQLLRISRRTLVARLTEYGFARPLKDRRSGSE
ncbi:MAG: sigma 54-interacting transcriptional regulator, partial [Polyangiaceae bacterium]